MSVPRRNNPVRCANLIECARGRHVVSSGSKRAVEASTPIYANIWLSWEMGLASEVQVASPPEVSEKYFVESEAICCIVEQDEMAGESVVQRLGLVADEDP